MHLMPLFMYQGEKKDDHEGTKRLRPASCAEYRLCAYVCPGKLHLIRSFQTGKAKPAVKAAWKGSGQRPRKRRRRPRRPRRSRPSERSDNSLPLLHSPGGGLLPRAGSSRKQRQIRCRFQDL